MSQLFNRICDLTLASKKFSYPPFSIEFEQTFSAGSISATIAKLYNPNSDTIKMAEPKKSGKTFTFPTCIINAGYKEDSGTCVYGEVIAFTVSKSGTERILELKISDASQKYACSQIMKTFENMKASQILSKILTDVGIDYKSQELGSDITYPKITLTTLKSALDRISRDTQSDYFFKNGVFEIKPKTYNKKKEVYLLSPQTGLIGSVEKNKTGIKFKTLFLYKIQPLEIVKIETRDYNGYFKITKGKKVFSTFSEGVSEFEAVAI